MKLIIIIMGVSGSGKTTIGKGLSQKTAIPFFDADDYHPQNNIQKMSHGKPLDDSDRMPWLSKLSQKINSWKNEKGAILACSALKESYRGTLYKGNKVHWVYLKSEFDMIRQRLEQRPNHFMKAELLKSQFDALEEPSYGLHIDSSRSTETIISIIKSELKILHD